MNGRRHALRSDTGHEGAYTAAVHSAVHVHHAAAGRGPATRKFRRRPPAQPEQARRKAWGDTWGRLLSEAGRKLRAERP